MVAWIVRTRRRRQIFGITFALALQTLYVLMQGWYFVSDREVYERDFRGKPQIFREAYQACLVDPKQL